MTGLMSRSGTETRVRATALDVEHSHRRSTALVGPLALPTMTRLIERYNALADLGPQARLCLEPSALTNLWRTVRLDGSEVITASDAVCTDGPPTELIAAVRAMRIHEIGSGIRILCAGDFLAIDFSHGLGEAPLITTLLDVLLGVVEPRDLVFPEHHGHHWPALLGAVLRTFSSDPRRANGLIDVYRRRPRRPTSGIGDESPFVRFSSSPATHFVGLPASAVAELRRRRDATMPGVSLMALCTYALWESLASAGLEVDRVVKIPYDVRRYLGKGPGTLASASAGLDFNLAADRGPSGLQADMDHSARCARPVVNHMASTLKAHRQRHRPAIAESHPRRPRVRLLHSNVLRSAPTRRWPFTDHTAAQMLVASEPVSAEGVTVTSAWTSGNLWFTAEFHDNVFDPNQIAAALDSLEMRIFDLLETSCP